MNLTDDWYQTTHPNLERPVNSKDTNPKDAIGSSKPSYHNVPVPVLYELGAAMTEGACKYAAYNYRIAGVRTSVYLAAARRHLDAFWEGENIDPDSGLSHITKAMASLAVLRDAQINNMIMLDDRPPSANPDWWTRARQQFAEVIDRYPDPRVPYTIDDQGELTLSVRLPYRDEDDIVFDMRESFIHVELRDLEHAKAVADALAEGQYKSRVMTVWRGCTPVYRAHRTSGDRDVGPEDSSRTPLFHVTITTEDGVDVKDMTDEVNETLQEEPEVPIEILEDEGSVE